MVGFSAEAILKALRGSPDPLIEAIAEGTVKGMGAVVGCKIAWVWTSAPSLQPEQHLSG